jgi:hypothetical protein
MYVYSNDLEQVYISIEYIPESHFPTITLDVYEKRFDFCIKDWDCGDGRDSKFGYDGCCRIFALEFKTYISKEINDILNNIIQKHMETYSDFPPIDLIYSSERRYRAEKCTGKLVGSLFSPRHDFQKEPNTCWICIEDKSIESIKL